MATEFRLRRGNTSATSSFVGAEGEVTVNTTNDSLHVHDGITSGGFETARADLTNVSNSTFAAKALSANVGGNISGNITGASTTATYVTIGSEGGLLPYSRRLQSGSGIVLSDGGAGGAASISANLSSSAPSNLGSANSGASNQIARADHVHAMPTANDVGAAAKTTYIIAGNGLSGTGNLSSNVTLTLSANLNHLGDVLTANVTNGDILVYNSATSKWNNTQNFPRLTTKYNSANVGTANVISTLNFIAGAEVTVATNANVSTQTDITLPTIFSATQIQNFAGNVVSSGINGGITASYDSVNKRTNFSANAFTLAVTGAVTGSTTISNLANASISTTLPANSVILGFHTSGSYLANTLAGLGMSATYTGNATTPTATLDVNVSSGHFTVGARDAISTGINNGSHGGIGIVYNRSANSFSFSANTFTVTLAGPITGSNTVTNLSNVTITTVLASNSVTLGTHTTGAYVANINTSGTGISVSGGGAAGATPTVTLNSASTNTPSYVVVRDSNGNFSANTITASLTGLASLNLPLTGGTLTGAVTLAADPTNSLHAATKQYVDNSGANVRVILTGDVTGNALASNVSTTLSTTGVTAGSYAGRFTVDAKGRITSAANLTTVSGYGITDAVTTSGTQTVGGDKTFSNNVTVGGNLVVQGTTFTINSTDVAISDKTFTVAKDATSGTTADQSGIQVAGAGANWLYDNTTSSWMSNKHIVPSTSNTYDLGTDAIRWRNAFLGGNLTVAGTINATVSGSVTTAGNITGGFTYSIPYQSATSTTAMLSAGTAGYVLTTNSGSGAPSWSNPATFSVNFANSATSATSAQTVSNAAQPSITSVGTLSSLVSGTITPSSNASVNFGNTSGYWGEVYTVGVTVGTGGIDTRGDVTPLANASINLGSASYWYNDVYAVTFRGVSTTAKYADLAEKYTTDQEYEVGTVVAVGGSAEVTASQAGDLAIGVVSAAPAYLMNSESNGQAIALKGRVPVKVVGPVRKGQRLIAGENGCALAVDGAHADKFAVALETNESSEVKLVEAIIL